MPYKLKTEGGIIKMLNFNSIRKKGLAALLALSLAAGTVSVASAAESVAEVPAEAAAVSVAETVEEPVNQSSFVDEITKEYTVNNMEDAKSVITDMAEKIGANEETEFEPWRTLTDSAGNNYYVFMQMYDNVTVSGGAVKVVADAAGKLLGVVSSVETQLPDEKADQGITGQEAEAIVVQTLMDQGHEEPDLLAENTAKVILPVNLELDPESEEEKEEVRYVWVVYTNNDSASMSGSTELPYLAHYVTMDGEYLYSLPTILPNDEAATSGYQSSYVFEFMEPADYTGKVTLSDGSEQEINVTLMRDSRTGMYYLGNIERRIVVADCYEFLYNKGNVILESSPDNSGWDNTCLLSLYNYCKVWDYYNEIGWKGGDGLGTPMIILKDFCDKNHEPIDNAAYAGLYYGWQVFLSSSINDFSQCLDVLAHEFTHCVTGSVMTYNAYMNDYGAINEAMSDIQGNICEIMNGATPDKEWLLGENGSVIVRSMSDPHDYMQPEYVWDIYYNANVKTPTDMNDRGGVHTNSSLLNRIAYMLCNDGGMTLEEARNFWFAVDCSMVPGTNYRQLAEIIPWVLQNLGYDKYKEALGIAIEVTKINSVDIPESLGEDRALITLRLPETEVFEDGNWALEILSASPDKIMERVLGILGDEGEFKGALGELKDKMLEAAGSFILEGGNREVFDEVLGEWIGKYMSGIVSFASGAAGQDGHTIKMVSNSGYTVPILAYMKFEPNDMVPSKVGLAVYIRGRWWDIMKPGIDFLKLSSEEATEEEINRALDEMFSKDSMFAKIFLPDENSKESKESIFFKIADGEICEIPSNGLEGIQPLDIELLKEVMPEMFEDSSESVPEEAA